MTEIRVFSLLSYSEYLRTKTRVRYGYGNSIPSVLAMDFAATFWEIPQSNNLGFLPVQGASL